ncbi:DUF177 domain-containing protein, partial [Pseudomonadota bacterium]
GTLKLIKLKNEISAIIEIADVKISLKCNKCMEPFTKEIEIEGVSREYMADPPKEESDISDIYLLDQKKLEIDLTEMVRQEIILHFPLFPVCSKSCLGLCSKCRKNLNKKICKCSRDVAEENKPFKDLKKIISK